jgi:CheY-like chemotaxis protein
MFCKKCGIEMDDDAFFCKFCGLAQKQIVNPPEKNINSSFPNSERYALETSESYQLLERFATHEKTGVKSNEYKILPEIWGILFSNLFISPMDLIDGMRDGIHKLGEENVHMLRLFIKEDCMSGGRFVETVIKKGGMIDRAALIIIADPHDLARIERDGTTAIHQLATVCDKLLSTLYDHNGMPALFLVFQRGDLRIHDLDAIGEVFSKSDLKKVKVKNGGGRDGLEIFNEISRSINYMAILEKTMAVAIPSEKKTEDEPEARPHINSPIQSECFNPPPMEILAWKDPVPEKISLPDITEVSGLEIPEPQENPDKSLKIMIVEDDPVIQHLLETWLNILGYNLIYKAGNGTDAVKLNQEVNADIIFMDINMPGKIDGIDAAREIKNTLANSKIIFLTGYGDTETIDRAKAVNPVGYILKPFTDMNIRIALKLIK